MKITETSTRAVLFSLLVLLVPIFLVMAACDGEETEAEPQPLALPADAQEAATAIDAATIEGLLRDLSDDSMEGRGPGTQGDLRAQQYIEDYMSALGLQPASETGTWRQPFDIVGISAEVPQAWSFRSGDDSLSLQWDDEFIAASGIQSERAEIEDAEVVFVGYGIQAPEHRWDDIKGEDLRGKVLLILNNDPDWDPDLFEGQTRLYYGRWTYKYESAAAHGAVGAIIIHTTSSAGYPWQVVQTSWTGPQFELPWEGEARVKISAWITEEAAGRLVSLGGFDLDELRQAARTKEFRPVHLGIRTSLALRNTLSETQTANVLGLIEGSDPEARDEVVVYTAHHDHLGIGAPDEEGDAIYNGALDNAAGVSMVLAIAKAFSELAEPPRRSVLFAFVGGEEQGLLGSQYYAQHPTFPPGRIAANVNLDGGNPWGRTKDIAYVGYGKSSLDRIADAAAALQNRRVTADQFPDRGYFYRSDQFSFAKIGVPAFYLDSGTDYVGRPPDWGRQTVERWTREKYHQSTDEFDESWSYEGMVDDAQLAFYCGVAVATETSLPSWKPGDEFEAARQSALAALGSSGNAE